MFRSAWGIFIGACVVIFLIPTIILSIYSYSITGEAFNFSTISSQSETWGQFGSLLGGLFGLSSALATMLTLWFVIYQSQKSIERSDAKDRDLQADKLLQDKKVEKHNEDVISFYEKVTSFNSAVSDFQNKVVKFNEAQEIRNHFEKYKLHRELFDDLIDNIAVDLRDFHHENEVKVIKRSEFYSSIFPRNNFNFFSAETTQDFDNNNARFNAIQISLREIYSWMNIRQEHYVYEGFLRSYSNLLSELNIDIRFRQGEVGCVYELATGRRLFNIKSFRAELELLVSICNRLVAFSNNQPFATSSFPDFLILESKLIDIGEQISTQDTSSSNRYKYSGDVYSHGESCIFHAYSMIRLSKIETDTNTRILIFEMRNLLVNIMNGNNNANGDEVKDFLQNIKDEVVTLMKVAEGDIYNEYSQIGLLNSASKNLSYAIVECS